jgi:hypothetical protein
MVNLKRLADRAKDVVEKRGGTGALKEDANELREIAKGKGSLKDKAKAAAEAMKDPGRQGADRAAEHGGAREAEPSVPRPRREPEGGTPPPER